VLAEAFARGVPGKRHDVKLNIAFKTLQRTTAFDRRCEPRDRFRSVSPP
jgi:hypothetical protein